jgi:nucleoside-diphosphate-sugar epimerase
MIEKKIAIIGGAGFIGHNLALSLKKLGAEVFLIDSLSVNNLNSVIDNKDNLPNPELAHTFLNERLSLIRKEKIKIFIQDARDYHALSQLLGLIKPNVVIHLAAVSHSNRSNKDPYSTFDHSFRTLENALDYSKNQIEHFIYFSSSMVYGNFNEKVVSENSVCEPIGIYGALKFSGEKLVIAYNQVFDLPYSIIRPSALYGERCISRRVGQIFIENAIQKKPIIIDGDGSDKLDFTYINDLIDGIVKIINNKNSINQIFNITHGNGRSIKDLIDILKKNFENIKTEYRKKDKLMPERGTLSINKAKKLINYTPQWNLEKGYQEYINWYKKVYKEFNKG